MPTQLEWTSYGLLIVLVALAGCSQPHDAGSDAQPVENVTASAPQKDASPAEDSVPADTPADGPASTGADGTRAEADAKPASAAPAQPSGPVALPLEREPVLLLSADEIRDGWIQLFDGQTLSGWECPVNINWHVTQAGEIEASEGDVGLLVTTVPFADFELRCDYWMAAGGNSGIFLRSVPEPKEPTVDCYELNICDSHPKFKTASLVGRAQPSEEVGGEETWKSFVVRAEGNRITVSLDGTQVLDHTDESAGVKLSGRIGLQKNEGLVRFRNVFVRPLGTTPIFNGQDLSGWRVVPGSKSEFQVEDGAITFSNGPGFLETEQAWDDFALQFEAFVDGDGLNSGLFFRLEPGTEDAPSNGYELQIENVFEEGDRRRPKDQAGTGAIFRRTKSRWVVPEDRQWFTVTLIADGPRIATWVNGLQMTDWVDSRKADPNPRRGLKTSAGPVSLQGHDATTRMRFRNLRVAAIRN